MLVMIPKNNCHRLRISQRITTHVPLGFGDPTRPKLVTTVDSSRNCGLGEAGLVRETMICIAQGTQSCYRSML